jgi:hypothetical protein
MPFRSRIPIATHIALVGYDTEKADMLADKKLAGAKALRISKVSKMKVRADSAFNSRLELPHPVDSLQTVLLVHKHASQNHPLRSASCVYGANGLKAVVSGLVNV